MNFSIQSIFGRLNYMKPKEVKQYLFRIRSLDSTKVLEKPLNIGKLDIVWRNPFSDIGRLQTNQLQQPIEAIATSIKKDLDVKVITDPDLCYLEKPLALDVQIKNTRFFIQRNFLFYLLKETFKLIFFKANVFLN